MAARRRLGLTLVRHGETEYNRAGLLQGQAIDAPLSETGRRQAAAAGSFLRDVRFSHVFSSDMLRARQTAEEIMQRNSSCLGLQMVCDPLLKEKSFGIAEGGRVQDLQEMAKAAGGTFPSFTPPEGETQEQVRERVRHFMEKLLQQIGAELWPVSHASCRAATSPAAGDDDDEGLCPLHALVVSHGAYLCEAMRYFVEERRCSLPPGCDRSRMFALSPNAGVCRFTLRVAAQGGGAMLTGMTCEFVHREGHINQQETVQQNQ